MTLCSACEMDAAIGEFPEPLCRDCRDDQELERIYGDPDREVDR